MIGWPIRTHSIAGNVLALTVNAQEPALHEFSRKRRWVAPGGSGTTHRPDVLVETSMLLLEMIGPVPKPAGFQHSAA
jgi:hypothetical protein